MCLGQSDGFVPFIEAIMFVTELVTAAFLFAQFVIIRSLGVLVLASGYLFTSLIILAHALAFPGAFGPNGLLGAGLQTSGWLAIIWHFVFPVSVIAYVLMKNSTTDTGQPVQTSATLTICWSAAIVSGLVFALTWGLIVADAYVPPLFLNKTTFAPLTIQTGLMDALICTLAFFLLWLRQSSFLDRWLMIAILAMILEMALLLIVPTRFTAGWYNGRMFGVIASTVVLVAFVIEGTVLYSRVANTIVLLRRERANRLMSLDAATSAMAHELRQPLTAIVTMSAAASNWLKRSPPDFEQMRICIASIRRRPTCK